MSTTRRDFLQSAAAVAGGLTFAPHVPWAVPGPAAAKSLRILILGGTGFIGPQMVEYALGRGHKLSLFNRGRSNPTLFPEAEKLEGDRNGKLDALKGKSWDVVIDNSGYVPRHVRDSAQLLKGNVGRYLFISTLSVIADFLVKGRDENAPTAQLTEPGSEDSSKHYGPLKALCEQEVLKAYGDQATVVRPGLVVGPGDPTDRFTYWPVRIDRGGEVLAPGDPTDAVRFIDVRDLAEWCIRLSERGVGGVFNAVGPEAVISIGEMLHGIKAVTTSEAQLRFVPTEFLEQQGVKPWSDMPVWFPPKGATAGHGYVSRAKAVANGLTFRPLAETAKATLDWFKTLPKDRQAKLSSGITMERETQVLAAWRNKT